MKPFADSIVGYVQAGWPCILPVPVAEKSPPPSGFTGAGGRDTQPLDLVNWAKTHGDWSVALRMPDGVVGIDVDHYDKGSVKKRGGDTLAEYEQTWGPLPDTWSSTARWSAGHVLDTPSRIMFFRVPAGRYATLLGEAIEIIQRHHRYAVVAPSIHQKVEQAYMWFGPDGCATTDVPKPTELPELPQRWVEGLREGATQAGPAAAGESQGQSMLAGLSANQAPACAEVANALTRAMELVSASSSGTRHDTCTERVHHLVQMGAAGHPGVTDALLRLRGVWEALTAGEGREGEFDRMALTSARKAVTKIGRNTPVPHHPCLTGGELWNPPAPAGPDDPAVTPVPAAAPRWWSPREIIGTHLFDPRADLDQGLAAEVLRRMWPVLRYAADARTWLLRGPDRWESRGDLTRWAVHELAELMPRGNPEAEKGSDELARAVRRRRLMMTPGRNAVGQSMAAAVAAGTHPCSLRLTDLDSEPHLLWAGGMPYDLRASADRPVVAAVDPNTPHLHSAACAPAEVPTPLWDAFLVAVWPDPEVRAWALRVLSITFTGIPDAALPILLGDPRRGKTQAVHLLMSVLGSYALAADPRLLGGGDNSHASIVFALKGCRLAFVDEGPRESRWAQERLKQLTGGGQLTGNAMRQDPVTFGPTHTLVLTANDEPPLTDPAVRARVRLLPCDGEEDTVRAARATIGELSGARWQAEAPGVLAQMIREAARWLADRNSALSANAPIGLMGRAEVIAAAQNTVLQWFADTCAPYEPGTRSSQLHINYVEWCRNHGVKPADQLSLPKWAKEMDRLGYPVDERRDANYRGLRIVPGEVTAFPQSLPVTTPPVEGPPASGGGSVGTFSADPPHPEIPGQTVLSDSSVEGEESLLRSINTTTHTQDHIANDHAISEISRERGVGTLRQAKTGKNVGPDLRKVPRRVGSPQPPTPPQPGLKADPGSGRFTKAAAKAAAKIEARIEAAGPIYQLPAAVDRAGTVVPLSLERAAAVIRAATARTGALTVDVEHTGYAVGHADYALRTVQLGGEDLTVVLDAADPAHREVGQVALAAAAKLHAHSATADLVPLVAAGWLDESAWDRMYDTVIPAKLADPSSTGSDPALKQLSGAVLGEVATAPGADEARARLFKVNGWLTDTKITTPVEKSGWAQVDHTCETMIRYDGSDVLDTAALAVRLPWPAADLLERERAVQRITARVTHRGLRIDRDRVTELEAEHQPAKQVAAERVQALGIENPGSDRQLADCLTALKVELPRTKPSKKFPEGQPSVAAGVLEGLRPPAQEAQELISAVLDYRHHETVLSTFLEPYRVLCERGDGRARPTIYTLGADTGRMSCVRPNFQNLPREGGVRSCITADEAWMLVSADFAGVEIRVMAALSQDPNLMKILAEGADLHSIVAAQAFGPEFTKADRYATKRGVFGWAYGGSVPVLARQVGVSESIMAAIVDSLGLVAPTYVAWTNEIKAQVRSGATQMPTYAGRVIHLHRQHPHKAPNYSIQGTARELLVDALIKWDTTEYGRGGVVVPIHDEILAVVPAEVAAEATKALVDCMTTQLYGVAITAQASEPSFAWQDAV
jgi:DNA polymerase I-like protein with 3'-5' exonuclease and polymerase domains/phage/plasmid-associated DNA primase